MQAYFYTVKNKAWVKEVECFFLFVLFLIKRKQKNKIKKQDKSLKAKDKSKE